MNEEQSQMLISILTDILLTMKDIQIVVKKIQDWQLNFDDVCREQGLELDFNKIKPKDFE